MSQLWIHDTCSECVQYLFVKFVKLSVCIDFMINVVTIALIQDLAQISFYIVSFIDMSNSLWYLNDGLKFLVSGHIIKNLLLYQSQSTTYSWSVKLIMDDSRHSRWTTSIQWSQQITLHLKQHKNGIVDLLTWVMWCYLIILFCIIKCCSFIWKGFFVYLCLVLLWHVITQVVGLMIQYQMIG